MIKELNSFSSNKTELSTVLESIKKIYRTGFETRKANVKYYVQPLCSYTDIESIFRNSNLLNKLYSLAGCKRDSGIVTEVTIKAIEEMTILDTIIEIRCGDENAFKLANNGIFQKDTEFELRFYENEIVVVFHLSKMYGNFCLSLERVNELINTKTEVNKFCYGVI